MRHTNGKKRIGDGKGGEGSRKGEREEHRCKEKLGEKMKTGLFRSPK